MRVDVDSDQLEAWRETSSTRNPLEVSSSLESSRESIDPSSATYRGLEDPLDLTPWEEVDEEPREVARGIDGVRIRPGRRRELSREGKTRRGGSHG